MKKTEVSEIPIKNANSTRSTEDRQNLEYNINNKLDIHVSVHHDTIHENDEVSSNTPMIPAGSDVRV